MSQNLPKYAQHFAKYFKLWPKWRNFAKCGHIGRYCSIFTTDPASQVEILGLLVMEAKVYRAQGRTSGRAFF